MSKTIAIKPNKHKDEGSNQPDYRMAVLDENEQWNECAALWKKQDKNGQTFLSGKMKEPYQDKAGYYIAIEKGQQEEDVTDVDF